MLNLRVVEPAILVDITRIPELDVIREVASPTKFLLVEVYRDAAAPAAHKETAHYKAWRETVEPMMASPRTSVKYGEVFPTTDAGWRSP